MRDPFDRVEVISHREFCRRVPGCTLGALSHWFRTLGEDGRNLRTDSGSINWPAARDAWIASKAKEDEGRVEDVNVKSAIDRATLRLKVGQAIARELENAELEGRVVPVDVVQEDAREACDAIRTSLLSLPSRVALRLEAVCASDAPRAPQIEALIHDEVNAILVALKSSKFVMAQ